MRLHLSFFLAIFMASAPAAQSETSSSNAAHSVEGFLRREPVLPLSLPDYELTTLDISKEIVFHVGEQTFVGKVPVLVYVPVNRSSRASAVDRLVEARTLLLKSAAAKEVTTADLAGLRDLIERALEDLRAVTITDKLPPPLPPKNTEIPVDGKGDGKSVGSTVSPTVIVPTISAPATTGSAATAPTSN